MESDDAAALYLRYVRGVDTNRGWMAHGGRGVRDFVVCRAGLGSILRQQDASSRAAELPPH